VAFFVIHNFNLCDVCFLINIKHSIYHVGMCAHLHLISNMHKVFVGPRICPFFHRTNTIIHTLNSYVFNSFHTLIPHFTVNSYPTLRGWLSLVFVPFRLLEMNFLWFSNDGFAKFIHCRRSLSKLFISQLN